MLPLFNKGVRKFTRVFRQVWEREIEKEMGDKKVELGKGGIREGLREELDEGESKLTKKMKEEKEQFIKKFQKH